MSERMTRRGAVALIGGTAGAAAAQQLIGEPAGRIAPANELVNTFEMAAMARRKLDSFTFAAIDDAGSGDRAVFDRMTFRPRLMINTTELDLTIDLFGQKSFAPILVGPAEGMQRFHPEGESAAARGATAAKATMIISERSSLALAKIAPDAPGFWYQVFAGTDVRAVRSKIDEAVKSGCKAVVLTGGGGADWAMVDQLRKGLSVPFLLKGVMSAAEAKTAVERGMQGIVISAYRGGPQVSGMTSSLEVLPSIVEAAGGRAPILIDGGFRRGGDVLKAIALGARAVTVTRPVLWGLAAYGAPGVQQVLELLQTETARAMGMCGKPNIASLDKTLVRLHKR